MKELTLARILFKAEECLESSKSSFKEEFLAAAVNGAYYSIYHSIQALLFVSGSFTKTHNGAHSKFRELFIKTEILDNDLNIKLQRSFEKRQFGDYDYDEVLYEDANESVDDAKQFLEATILYLRKNNYLQ